MLNINDFPIIKEIQSLITQKIEFEQQIINAQQRIQKLVTKKSHNQDRKREVEKQILQTTNQTDSLEKEANKKAMQLNRKKEQLTIVTSDKQLQSLKSEIESLEKTKESLEEEALELLEQLDLLSSEQSDLLEFFKNIDQTIDEISTEVQVQTSELEKSVSITKERVKLLLDELSPLAKDKTRRCLNSKILPFTTRLKGQACSHCGMSIPSENMTHILSMTKLISCSGCSRLILE